MNVIGITGITPEILAELKKGRPRTLEFVTAQNVISAASVSVGDQIFITSVHQDDLSSGDSGFIATVTASSVTMQRISNTVHGVYHEERERLSVRLQLKYSCASHVKTVIQRGYCDVLLVEVAECHVHRVR